MIDRDLLHDFARKYVWWRPTETAVDHPELVLRQVMNLGTYEDWVRLETNTDRARLEQVLRTAEAGQFSDKSWHFWHLRLKLSDGAGVPGPPRRRFQ